jgi:hypothetical protein
MRPAVAIVLGIVLTMGLAYAGQLATAVLLAAPDGSPLPLGRTFFSATLAITFGASVVGAFVGAHLASSRRNVVAVAIALASAAFGVIAALDAPPEAPPIVAWMMPVVALLGGLGGGGVRAMNRSARPSPR